MDWRAGGDHFFGWLLDGDVANNYGNWQWVAGTGNDTKPYRRFNPIRQADGSTRTATTCAATCRSWRRWRARRCTSRGGCPRRLRQTLDYPPPLAVPGTDPVWLR